MTLLISTPTGPHRFGDTAAPALEFAATGQTGVVSWSVSEGAMSPSSGASSVLTPLNITRTLATGRPLTITAHDAGSGQTATATFDVEATLPTVADYGVESDVNPGFELSIPERGAPKFRVIPRTASWPLIFKIRQYPDYAAVRDFLIDNETLPFWLEDPQLGELNLVYQDSAFRRGAQRVNWIEYSVQLKDYDYQPPVEIADFGPFSPSFIDLESGGRFLLESGGGRLLLEA